MDLMYRECYCETIYRPIRSIYSLGYIGLITVVLSTLISSKFQAYNRIFLIQKFDLEISSESRHANELIVNLSYKKYLAKD
jgi:hypothetical protein